MPKASPIRTNFNAGELSPLLDGRVDIAKYEAGCRVMENFLPTVQGPAVRRAGTRYVAEVKTSANRTWLARFEFSTTQAYVLEFGNQYIRFYTNHGVLLNVGVPYEIATPYTTADLTDATDGTFRLSMAQSGDIIYIAHPSYPLQKLSRLGATNWTLTEVVLTNGPFKTQNSTRTTTMYASATTGAGVTLTANVATFTSATERAFTCPAVDWPVTRSRFATPLMRKTVSSARPPRTWTKRSAWALRAARS